MPASQNNKSSNNPSKDTWIKPSDLIDKYSVEELNTFADDYYKKIPLPEFQLGKPFSMPTEAPQLLLRLGLLLDNLMLGPGTKVLDFGAGTCWLSKALWQMGCEVYALDVSREALKLGKQLFTEYPVPMRENGNWNLLHFDGHKIDLDDNSIDRVICFDTFHHIPNPENTVKELSRVLKDGGIIALNEPIGEHSSTESSQREMRDYNVLENDLDLGELVKNFESHGLTNPRFKVVPSPRSYYDLTELISIQSGNPPRRLLGDLREFAQSGVVVLFQKGDIKLDSRSNEGLRHSLSIDKDVIVSTPEKPSTINLTIRNIGTATWLHGTGTTTGIVNVGTQLVDPITHQLLSEHARFHLPRDVEPGEILEMTLTFSFSKPGEYTLRLDLVSEIVCWFKDVGSKPLFIKATIE